LTQRKDEADVPGFQAVRRDRKIISGIMATAGVALTGICSRSGRGSQPV
jgi:hypothetical protein